MAEPNPMQEQFSRMLEQFRMPGMDMHALLESQQKNLEALRESTRIAGEGAAAVTRRQQEIVQQALEQAAAIMRDFKMPGSPGEAAAAQQELARKAVETALANARELAEMVNKSSREAFEVIQRRTAESLEELRKTALKHQGS
jgi:phasin family protein